MKELGRFISDSHGTIRTVFEEQLPQFPDKKKVRVDPTKIEKAVRLVREIKEDAEVGSANRYMDTSIRT